MAPSEMYPEGAKWAHLDGGNRCDDFLLFWRGEVKILAGDYQFQPVKYDDGTAEVSGHAENVKQECNIEELREKHPIIYDKLMMQQILVFSFSDLSQDERAEMFKILNAGENLNDQELRNPSTADICTITRDKLNRLWKSLFIEVGAITDKKAERFGFCLWLAQLAYAFCDQSFVPSFGNKDELNDAYKTGSSQDMNNLKFVDFFEKQYLPYIKLMQENEWSFQHRALFNDFFLLLKYMVNNRLKIPNINKKGREAFWTCFTQWQAERFADVTESFPLKSGHTKWSGLFSKKSEAVLKYRLEGMIKGYSRKWTIMVGNKAVDSEHEFGSFIDYALEQKVLVKLDKKRVADISDKSFMFLKESKTSTGKEIHVGHYSDTKKYQADHVEIPYAHGGKSDKEDMKLETAEYNRTKGAKTPTEIKQLETV